MATKWEKLPAVDPHGGGCMNCPSPQRLAPMEMVIAVGFGSACVLRDDDCVWDENEAVHAGKDFDDFWTVADAEKAAAADPDHDWRIVKDGPLHGETYQRQGDGQWVCVETNQGFA